MTVGTRLEQRVKVSRPTGDPWVIILVLHAGHGQKKITRGLYCVICKQKKDRILVIERECINTRMTMDYLSLSNNT